MNTTSMPGSTLVARSMRTASCIDAARHRWGAKLSIAHWMILGAERRSNSAFSSASSSSWNWGTGRAGGSTRKLMRRVPSGAGALADADLGLVRAGLVVVHVVVGGLVGQRELVQLLERGPDGLGAARTVHPLAERLARLTLVGEPADDPHGGLGRVLGREAQGLLAEVGLRLADVAAEQHLVAGGRAAVGPALGAEEPDVGGVVLPAAVGAARDVDAEAADVGEALLLELVADGGAEAAALGDGQVAGVGTRAGDDVADQLGAGLAHADGVEPLVKRRELLLGEAAEGDVLPVGEAHLEAHLALDGGEGPELGAGHVAQAGVGDGRHGALGRAAHDVGVVPPTEGVALGDLHGHALAHRGERDALGPAGGGVAGLGDLVGDAARPPGRPQQRGALLDPPPADFAPAGGNAEPLHAGAQLVVAVAVVVEDPEDRLEGGHEVFPRGELLECHRLRRVGAQTASHEDLEPGLDGAVLEGAGGGDDTGVVEQRLAAVGGAAGEVDLELAGQALADRVAHEVLVGGLGPRGDVELLVR